MLLIVYIMISLIKRFREHETEKILYLVIIRYKNLKINFFRRARAF